MMSKPKRRANQAASAFLMLLVTSMHADADLVWFEWDSSQGGNGHLYALTSGDYANWQDAESEAVAAGGHLVAINDIAENNWINQMFCQNPVFPYTLWLGLYQDLSDPQYAEPGGGWKWSSGEPLIYANWYSGEPNNTGGGEDFAVVYNAGADRPPGTWNDQLGQDAYPQKGIIEVPEPSAVLLLLASLPLISRRRY